MSDAGGNTIVVQFRVDVELSDERLFALYEQMERWLEAARKEAGRYLWGQWSGGTMEIFLAGVWDLQKGLQVVERKLADEGWLHRCKIAYKQGEGGYRVYYPEGAEFSLIG